jgi:SAM-dependent methyltransferase
MRRGTRLALVTGGTLAVVTAGAFASGVLIVPIEKISSRLRRRGPTAPASSGEASQYSLYAPGGPWGFLFNGPVGWASSKYMPIMQAGMYQLVAEMLDLQPEDELLDIGCGPGAFLANKGQRARRVAGLDASPVMLRDAQRRLAGRISAGTARLVLGSAAELPFSDGEFSAVSVVSAPANMAEVFRVLRPGGRFVCVFEIVADRKKPDGERAAIAVNWDEADTRRILEETGFTDLTVRHQGYSFLGAERIVSCRKPAASRQTASIEIGVPQHAG